MQQDIIHGKQVFKYQISLYCMQEDVIETTVGKTKSKILVQTFNDKDKSTLKELYGLWIQLNHGMKLCKARAVNLPEGISESAFCMHFGGNYARALKVFKGSGSFDVINLDNGERIQIKACSVDGDLTSFGPKSVWDKIYFLDFYREGKEDGSFDVYLIPNKKIYLHKTNKNQTMQDQQKEKRRPRFSIKESIIKSYNIKPVKTCQI